MLLLKKSVLTLQLLQPLYRTGAWSSASRGFRPEALGSETSLSELVSPSGQHVGMDVQRLGDRLYLHPWPMTELHRRALELDSVRLGLLRAGSAHPTPPG